MDLLTGPISKALLVYGPLGILALVATAIAVRMYRDLVAERKSHADDMHAFQDRYITKAESWMQQYYELQKRMTDLVEAMSTRSNKP